MKHPLPPLDSLKVFESAARHLSFNRAAEELCLSKGAVSYQIRKLEEHLQRTLFRRSTRQVFLNEAGQVLFKATQAMFREIGDTLNQLSGDAGKHDVYIAATTYVALRWLSPRIARFNEQFPDVSVLFQHSVNSLDFRLQDVDLAVRWGECSGNKERGRLLEIPMPLFPACSPGLIQRLKISSDRPIPITALGSALWSKVPLLCEERSLDLWQTWETSMQADLTNPRRIISDANVRVQAAIDGQGLVLADALLKNEFHNGLLVAPFQGQLDGYGYSIYCSQLRSINPKVAALRDWLIDTANS